MDLKARQAAEHPKEIGLSSEQTGEARQAGREETESRQAMHEPKAQLTPSDSSATPAAADGSRTVPSASAFSMRCALSPSNGGAWFG